MTEDKLTVKGIDVRYKRIAQEYYISLTDIARFKNESTKDVIKNRLRKKETIAFLGLWETLNNPDFKGVEFDLFRNEAGYNAFTLSVEQWVGKTNAIGITASRGRYSQGTFAHKDIAFEFASWVSVEFKLYMIREYQRLREEEQKTLEWNAKRELAKVNYLFHTNAIKEIPNTILNVLGFSPDVRETNDSEMAFMNTLNMTETESEVYKLIYEGTVRKTADIPKIMDINPRTAQRTLAKLADKGYIQKEGGKNSGILVPVKQK
ncbi:KilA-N domain protein [Candidatus Methanoplasma termitum]|uniref:KilA-N domain protein n=1 Tax=Candidatus Methanoplasma termitum TaxID=1577791 RepID=A0A0A7LDK7_9ARCH|nr:KilA-N domain-containing protein [Candidatus Methanoplasma termitum]AIZ56412.1 KilA-N domain protein [Candidatus Methanoplasma termitum]